MAIRQTTTVHAAALAAIFFALAIGSAPVTALLILSERMEVLK